VCLITKNILKKHNVKIKFLLVGGWNTVFGYLVFILLETWFSKIFYPKYIAYVSAMVIGQFFSITNAFIFHKYFTFKSAAQGRELIKEFFRFNAMYAVSFVLSIILLPVFVEIFLFPPKIAGAFTILIVAFISYIGHSRYSFRTGNTSG